MKTTSEYLEIFEAKTGLTWENSTWKNDLTDSIYNEEHGVKVMLPNSDTYNESEELFNCFCLNVENSEKPEIFDLQEKYNFEAFFTEEDIIEELKKLLS